MCLLWRPICFRYCWTWSCCSCVSNIGQGNNMDNHLISRAFSLYAELLQLHGQDERLADWLSGAAYRIRQMEKPVTDLSKAELTEQFRPEIVEIIHEGRKRHNIAALEELIQLTPAGLFDMMRIKGLGGMVAAALVAGRGGVDREADGLAVFLGDDVDVIAVGQVRVDQLPE